MEIVKIRISDKNNDVGRVVQKIKNRNGGYYSDEICRLIREAYNIDQYSSIPRMDIFHDKRIRGKTIAESLYDGHISEQEIANMFLSCKIFLEEMYSSPTLLRIVDRHCGKIDCTKIQRGLDKWLLQH